MIKILPHTMLVALLASSPWLLRAQELSCSRVGFNPPLQVLADVDNCVIPGVGEIIRTRNWVIEASVVRNVLSDQGQSVVLERVSWTQPGSDDVFLVLDRNGNGRIDDGRELFGNFTPQPDSASPNGFVALATFDDPALGGDGDGWLTSEDMAFELMALWRDINHDGVSQPSEMTPLLSSPIQRIQLNFRESRRTDQTATHSASFRWSMWRHPRIAAIADALPWMSFS